MVGMLWPASCTAMIAQEHAAAVSLESKHAMTACACLLLQMPAMLMHIMCSCPGCAVWTASGLCRVMRRVAQPMTAAAAARMHTHTQAEVQAWVQRQIEHGRVPAQHFQMQVIVSQHDQSLQHNYWPSLKQIHLLQDRCCVPHTSACTAYLCG
jgi:hypothetical protein